MTNEQARIKILEATSHAWAMIRNMTDYDKMVDIARATDGWSEYPTVTHMVRVYIKELWDSDNFTFQGAVDAGAKYLSTLRSGETGVSDTGHSR